MYDEDGVYRKYTAIRFGLPSDSLMTAYEEAKAEFSEDLRESLLADIRAEKAEDEEDERLSPSEIASKIVEEDRVEAYISESPGGEYVDRDLLKVDFAVTESESKQVKKLLIREGNLNGVM
jgi:hypothetical protein